MQGYKAFSDRMGLPMQYGRIRQDGLSGRFSPTKKEFSIAIEGKDVKLREEELGALLRYKGSDSFKINAVLRTANGLSGLSKDQGDFVYWLDSALSKTKTYDGHLVRVIDFSDYPDEKEKVSEFLSDFVPGSTVKSKSYWSTSKKEGYNPTAEIKIYIANSRKGRDISTIGLDESEVLYERKQKFYVHEKEFKEGKWYILLTEE